MIDKIKLVTGEEIENDFWVCFFHTGRPEIVDNSSNKEEKSKSLLSVSDSLDKNHFPIFLRMDRVLVKTEADFESFRLKNFPHYPSRCSSFYVFPSLDEAKKVITTFGWKYHSLANVKINIEKNYNAFKANMEYISSYRALLSSNQFIPEGIISNYWNGIFNTIEYADGSIYPPIIEILIEGEVLVKKYIP